LFHRRDADRRSTGIPIPSEQFRVADGLGGYCNLHSKKTEEARHRYCIVPKYGDFRTESRARCHQRHDSLGQLQRHPVLRENGIQDIQSCARSAAQGWNTRGPHIDNLFFDLDRAILMEQDCLCDLKSFWPFSMSLPQESVPSATSFLIWRKQAISKTFPYCTHEGKEPE
jgi:hypothetical protein